MKILIYVGDLVTDLPSLFLGEMIARHLSAEITLLNVGKCRIPNTSRSGRRGT